MVARVMGFKIPISRTYLEEIYSKLEEENNWKNTYILVS
jgi:branched-subunit amino acid aminotransferase/4-amino-4-deoxychorismate lyase